MSAQIVVVALTNVTDNGVAHKPGETFVMEASLVGAHIAAGQVRQATEIQAAEHHIAIAEEAKAAWERELQAAKAKVAEGKGGKADVKR